MTDTTTLPTRTDPWHALGTPVNGETDVKKALALVDADFTAYTAPLHATGNLGVVDCDDKIAVVADRMGPDGVERGQILGIHGNGYKVVQYDVVVEKALAVVGAYEGDAALDVVALLNNGKRFFAGVKLDNLIIDPMGISDVIERYMILYSSHDGTVSVTYAFTNVRLACFNALHYTINSAPRVLKAKHTARVDWRLEKEEAQRVLGVSTEWADAFKQKAESLLHVPYTEKGFDTVLNKVFPYPRGAASTDRQRENTDEVRAYVKGVFRNDRNAGGYGENGWTMYNAIGEYLDHVRDATPEERMKASMTIDGWVDKRKDRAATAILALTN